MRSLTKRCKPMQGLVRIFDNSSLRKLMRAARRGQLPAERLEIIERAVKSAAEKPR